jgi:hypothetical protein
MLVRSLDNLQATLIEEIMFWIIFVLIVFAFVYLFLISKPKALYYRNITFSELPKYLEGLLEVFSDGSALIIRHQDSERSVLFYKSIRGTQRWLNFTIPDAPWSRSYLPEIEKIFKKDNVKYFTQSKDHKESPNNLTVRSISNVDFALSLLKVSLYVMELDENAIFEVHYEGSHSYKESKKYFENKIEGRHDRVK